MADRDSGAHTLVVSIPTVPYGPKGVDPAESDRRYYLDAARNIRYHASRGNAFAGSNVTETVARLCESVARALGEMTGIPEAKENETA